MPVPIPESLPSAIAPHPEPDWSVVSRLPIAGSDEPLVPLSLAPAPLRIFPVYAKQGLPGAIDECYVREGVYRRLLRVARALPTDYGLVVLDGWRPWRVQQYLFETLHEALRAHHPELSEEALLERTREFVAVPSRDARAPSPHLTGGAVDVTLSDADGLPLDMGTLFDEAVPASHTAALEAIARPTSRERQARDNRRRLYGAMLEQGFTNLPSEWWHFDAGDQLWAHYGGHQQAVYGPAELETVESRWRRQL
ncbi:M15 family metallopeptidase [Halomonas cerina]|uniref:D-alanyl-D-alanine dipeptidase n=1 Tax=Halomonas cerina TaxID=447424 RepID=A0A839VC70_9GAMM|nr:M15 family metallopeptidase [Halomonas cerina]MBB3190297.1 D-alanyl-D-alanine dipeptidase [Halomonas cerina]